MKVIKAGEVIAELPDSPKDFEGSTKGGNVYVVCGDGDVKLGHYSSHERAGEVMLALSEAYFANEP